MQRRVGRERGSERPDVRTLLAKYRTRASWECAWLISSSFVPFVALWALAYASLDSSYWVTLVLCACGAAFLVRIFTIQHDCSHESFSSSKKVNNWVGMICSVLTLVPYFEWKRHHNWHHATAGDLARRGHGDIYTMTVAEYRSASTWDRTKYRLFRNPLIMFVLGPPLLFLVLRRVPSYTPREWRRERRGVYATDAAIVLLYGLLAWALGFGRMLEVHGPLYVMAAWMGTWVFYIAHQFPMTYWEGPEKWDFVRAAMEGSSYYKLPRPMEWISNNIGLHHIHHFAPQIPGHKLRRCMEENRYFQEVEPIGLREGLKAMRLALWDEEQRRLIAFRDLRRSGKGPGQLEEATA